MSDLAHKNGQGAFLTCYNRLVIASVFIYYQRPIMVCRWGCNSTSIFLKDFNLLLQYIEPVVRVRK